MIIYDSIEEANKRRLCNIKWKKANPEYSKAYYKKYREANKAYLKEQHKEYSKNYYKRPQSKLAKAMRNALYRTIKHIGLSKEHQTFKYFSCTPAELKVHLEKQFKEGMSWDNHGKWHIDHIKPLSSFTQDTIMQANHYTNLQPLWAEDNLSKSDKIVF